MGGYLPGYPDIALAYPILLYARELENMHARNPTRDREMGVAYCGNFRISQSCLLKGINCLFASKDHVRPVSKRLCIRESVDSLCRDGADTPMPPYIGKAFTRTNFEDLSLFRYMIMVCE